MSLSLVRATESGDVDALAVEVRRRLVEGDRFAALLGRGDPVGCQKSVLGR